MNYPIDVWMSGAVELGPDVVCDGFLVDKTARVQTHVHSDHMSEFESSKGTQEIIASPETHAMLCTEHDADLPYRRNFVAVESGRSIEVGDCRVWTLRSGHMLGAVQVGVELDDGTCIGYSGDFQWPLAAPLEVEALIIDATYGSPASVREYTQDDAEAELVSLIARLLPAGPVSILAHRGTLQRALQLINGEVQCDVVGSERLIKEVGVYRQYGYPIGPVMSVTSPEGKQVMESGRYIRVYGSGDAKPVSGPGSSIRLSAYFTRPDAAVVEYSPSAFCVALSNHADFVGTLEYVQATGAKYVITDNTRGGKGVELALEIAKRLGVEAYPSSSEDRREWGK